MQLPLADFPAVCFEFCDGKQQMKIQKHISWVAGQYTKLATESSPLKIFKTTTWSAGSSSSNDADGGDLVANWCAQNPQFGDWEEPPFHHDDDHDDDDDMYIMMKWLCVCHEKWALFPPELSAGGAKGDAR